MELKDVAEYATEVSFRGALDGVEVVLEWY
ncbi:hypothetical protein A2U01_0072367, partial [Trifolium medium]|nr:hypothetical protein [Trifolium medium]